MLISPVRFTRRALLAAALPAPAFAAVGGAAAERAAVAPALTRPALVARRAEGAVLLAAAKAGPRLVAVGERGLVLASDDDGVTWRQQPTPVSETLTAVRFVDARRGAAVGHGGLVLRTDDAGARWRVVLDGREAARLALEAAHAAGRGEDIALAERLVAEGADKPFLDLQMPDASTLVVVGAYGLAFASSDGGQRWAAWLDRFDNPKALHLYALRQRGEQWLAAGEQGLLLQSTDGGRRFRRLASPYRGSFFVAELLDERTFVVAGLRGHLWRSADAGRSWTQVAAPPSASITASFTASLRTPEGGLLFANQAGFVMKLAADRLEPMHEHALPPINGLVLGERGRLTALTLTGAVPLPLAAVAK
jgi:photosystem II stability/assembly factor-like uncharacterized protein